MGKVEVMLKSSLVTKNLRLDRKPTVFTRSILKLSEDKRHPGKIIRVYAHINDDYKVFGAFTINTGGSVSFFPDFYNFDNFDHLTLSKDFIKNKGHLTKVEPLKETEKMFYSKIGKNYYVLNIDNNIKLTINSNTFRIITVDKITKLN